MTDVDVDASADASLEFGNEVSVDHRALDPRRDDQKSLLCRVQCSVQMAGMLEHADASNRDVSDLLRFITRVLLLDLFVLGGRLAAQDDDLHLLSWDTELLQIGVEGWARLRSSDLDT